MNQKPYIANAVLWAATIIAAAVSGAPAFFSVVLLPLLAGAALLMTWPKCHRDSLPGGDEPVS